MSGVESGATGNLWEVFLSHWELIKVEPANIIALIGRLPANNSA